MKVYRLALPILVTTLTACAGANPQRWDLECGEQRCNASIEQHPGQTSWYIFIESPCGIVQTTQGVLPICNHERYVGNGDVEIIPGSCRVCTKKP